MKRNNLEFDIFPLVVKASQLSRISIYSKMSTDGSESKVNPWGKIKTGGVFSPEKEYVIKITPRLKKKSYNQETTQAKYTIENDHIIFNHVFEDEQEHMVFVSEVYKGEEVQIALFKIYSLYDDLYEYLPFKGEMHMHSNFSDGTEPPEIMYAHARKAGMEFASLTDHYYLQPGKMLREMVEDTKTGLVVLNGEEVHKLGQKMHIVSIGAKACISKMLEDNYEEYVEKAKEISASHAGLPEDVDPVEYGLQRIVFDKIRENGGISILAHPYWPWENNAVYIPESLTRLTIEEDFVDAWEITGVDDGDKDYLQYVLYNEERDRNYNKPVVGSTDAHRKENLGNGFSIVFAEDCTYESIARAVKDNRSIGIRQYPVSGGQVRYMAYGPSRLARYAIFLLNEFYIIHNRLCFIEGELMVEYFSGNRWTLGLIGEVARNIGLEKEKYFGR